MAAQDSITLLHLSDMQFGRHHRFGNLSAGDPDARFDTLLTRLVDDLKRLAKNPGIQPQVIVVSGDLAEWGMRSEFSDALEFLERLSESLGVPRRNVVVVPGNHDVNRKLCEAYFNECDGDEREPAAPYARKWEHFARMFSEFYADEPGVEFKVTEPWSLWEMESLNLVVAGLNSTMRESHHDDDHYGWVGERQLRWFADRLEAYVESGWFRLGVVHHNTARGVVTDDENLRDADQLAEVLAPSLNLLLHGHTHDSKISSLGQEPPLRVLSTGSAALSHEARPAEVPNQYQLIRLHSGGIERWTRRYDLGRKRWIADTGCSPDGNGWNVAHEVKFSAVHGAFGDHTDAPSTEPEECAEPRVPRPRTQDPDDGFLARVSEICELRYGGGRRQTVLDVRRAQDGRDFLDVRVVEDEVALMFPVGLAATGVTEEIIADFCREVFEPYYWTLDPNLPCTIVYGGNEQAPDELIASAGARNVRLRSFVEFQGIIDFRGYVVRQTQRLFSNDVYRPEHYVPQKLVNEARSERRTSPDAVAELITWLREPRARFVLVLGDSGTGKTFLLRELARQMSEEIPHLVPVLIDMRLLEKARTLDELVAQHLATAGERFIDLKAFPYMLREGRIALLFDGFDELAQRVTYKRATEHFETLLQAAGGDAKVVVTSRTEHFESDRQVHSALLERAGRLPGLSLCHLPPFDEPQIRAFLRSRLGNDEAADDRYDLIAEIQDLLGLSHNPRMLGFIADIPTDRLRRATPQTGTLTAAQLYSVLIDQWLDPEWDMLARDGAISTISPEQGWVALKALALCLWAKLERTIDVNELTEVVSSAVQQLSAQANEGTPMDPHLVAHVVGSRTLLVRDPEGAFAFVHSSVIEWLVANDVAAQLAVGAQPAALALREMTALMTDFVCELAGAQRALAWARDAISSNERSRIRANALLMLDRLGEKARGASLAGENLSGRDLSGQDLSGATLATANLTESRLEAADLSYADLTGATLVRADLTRAVLVGATLDAADAHGAQLLGADLRGAKLGRTNLSRAKLVGTLIDDGALANCDTFGAALPGRGAPDPMLAAAGSPATVVAMHPISEIAASGHSDGSVRLLDLATGTQLRTLVGHWGGIWGIAFSPDGQTLASAGGDGDVCIWDPCTGTQLRTLTGHEGGVRGVAFSPNGQTLASAGGDGNVCIWDPSAGTQLRTLTGHEGGVRGVAFSPDGQTLASAGADACVRVWDASAGTQLRTLTGHRGRVWGVAFSPDGECVASAGDDGSLRLWNPATGVAQHTLTGHRGAAWGVAFSPDGACIASAGEDGSLRIWDPATESAIRAFTGQQLGIRAVVFSPDGRALATASPGRGIELWDPSCGERCALLQGHVGGVETVAFSPDGQTIVSAGTDGNVRLWDPVAGVVRHTLTGHQGEVRGVAYSSDGRTVVSAGVDGSVRLWDPASATLLHTLTGHQGGVWGISISSSVHAASAGDDGSVRLWNTTTGASLQTLTGHRGRVWGVAFAPDGQRLASAGNDRSVRVWNVAKGTTVRTLIGHEAWVLGVTFSPDGHTLASASVDGTIRIWEVFTAANARVLHHAGVRAVAFSPDERTLASAGDDGTVRVWDLATGALIATVVGLQEGWVAFTPSGRYKVAGRIGATFWFAMGLCRFAPGELDAFLDPGALSRVERGDPL
ncbi:MAG: hypothetical protein QOD83_257 [Solirubrobacteraceae bacterium]|nr:hypothetical protein [Solirubrobacteraceae bacterium]